MSNAPQATAPPAPPEHVMKKSMPYLFAFTAFCQGFGVVLILQYLSFFVTTYMGMSLASLAAVLSICTTADWIFTIITGAIVQKTMTRWGQFRPYLLSMPLIIITGYIIVFWGIQTSDLAMTIIIGVCYGATGFAWQCLTASNGGLLAKVAGGSAANRLSITSKNAIGARLAAFFVGIITGPYIQAGTAAGGNPYLVLTLIYGSLTVLPNIFLFIFTKDIDVYDPNFKAPTSSTNVNPIEMYKETFKNPHFIVVFVTAIISGLGAQAISPLNTFYYRFSLGNYFIGDLSGMALMAIASTISTPVGIAAATFMPPIARKMGKKNSTVFVRYFAVATGLLTAFFTDNNFIMKVALVSIGSFSGAISGAWGINIYLDVAEYQEWKTGKDMKAFILGMSQMTARISAMIGTPLAAFVLGNVGYDQASNTIADTFRLCMFIGLAPAISNALGGVIFHAGYGLTEEKAREYTDENTARKAAAAAAAAAESPAPATS